MIALKESSGPLVGSFYYIGGKFYSYTEPIDIRVDDGDGDFPVLHDSLWDRLQEENPEFRNYPYYYYPRGRVIYNYDDKLFEIGLCDVRFKRMPWMVDDIKKEYNLGGYPTRIEWDIHR